MNCVACKQSNAGERNYCGACGTPLARYCSLCGFRNGATDRYCGGCGASVGPVRSGPAEARVAPAAVGSAASPVPPSPAPESPVPTPGAPGLADLLQAAKESVEAAAGEADVKVSQDDIDSLFGE